MIRIRSRILCRLPRPLNATRPYASASPANLAPAVALKTEEEPELPTTAGAERPKSLPLPPRNVLNLPSMVPGDARVITDGAIQEALYPSYGVIDASSMISICLRRPESTPRAYNIFRQLLADYDAGIRPLPESEVFGKVLEGLVIMSESPSSRSDPRWKARIDRLVQRWESYRGITRSGTGQAALDAGGIKVYRGWFMGFVRSDSSPLPLVPYFQSGSLRVEDLMSGVRQADVEAAFENLRKLAETEKMQGLEDSIRRLATEVQEQRDAAAREVAPEIRPVGPTPVQSKLVSKASSEGDPDMRFSIANLRKALEPINSAAAPILRQRALEESSLTAAAEELEHSWKQMESRLEGASQAMGRDQLQAWMHEWLTALGERLAVDILNLKEKVENHRAKFPHSVTDLDMDDQAEPKADIKEQNARKDEILHLLLTVLSPQKLALITVLELMRGIGSQGIIDGIKTVRAIFNVGKAVETEYQAETIQSLAGTDSRTWQNALDPNTQQPNSRLITAAWQRIGKGLSTGDHRPGEVNWDEYWTPAWTQMQIIDVGSFLCSALIETAKVKRSAEHPKTKQTITEIQPAFAHTYEYVKGKKLGVLRLNPVVASRMSADRMPSIIHPKSLPMLVEPRKWESTDVGGYLTSKSAIMRAKDAVEQTTYLKQSMEEKHLEPILHALDVLSATPWRINRAVFDVVLEVWNKGEAVADIPASAGNSMYKYPVEIPYDADTRTRSNWLQQRKQVLMQERKDHGSRCKINYTLEVARAFLFDTFYLPHNMDFRGRAYPIPPHLSPVGDDLNRGLLLFAEGKPLGSGGMRWLNIHLANVYGYDKMSFDERARFSEDHIKDILDSADRPLEGDRWWLKGEDPWQCLATCKEIAGALRSPNPEEYVSHMPVHQDGTCNGMQHYAALGGDVQGARAVNLEDGDRPADIYTRVVEIVNRVVEKDREAGHELAMCITEPLTRKIVKQTVMTTVYGVTFVGARDQIAKQLVSRTDVQTKDVYLVSAYLAKTVLSCIGDLFAGARDIQDWLTVAARLISRSIPPGRVDKASEPIPEKAHASKTGVASLRKKPKPNRLSKELMSAVIWTTPLGLPVVQPYRKQAKKQVMTALQTVYVSDPYQATEVSTVKQASAFPPNFIHSLDATHMFMTALGCKRHNISFAAVHDSYWTHAATVDPMSDLIRDAFISLHSQNLIDELRTEFLERCGENYIPLTNAKAITESAKARQEKEQARRAAVRAALGDSYGDSAAASASDPIDDVSEIEAELADSSADTLSSLAHAEVEVLGDEPVSSAIEPEGFTADELETLVKKTRAGASAGFDIHMRNGVSFVKLKDLLPPTPPRGEFDVEKTRTSQYFFS